MFTQSVQRADAAWQARVALRAYRNSVLRARDKRERGFDDDVKYHLADSMHYRQRYVALRQWGRVQS